MNRATLKSIPRAVYRAPRTLPDDLEQRRFRTRMRSDPSAPELVLSPHLDDAVLDCWGLLASERPLSVVNVFAGVPPAGNLTLWDAMTGAEDSAARVRARLEEDAGALARASRTAHNLANLDAQYRARFARPRLGELDAALVEILAGVSRVHVPAGIGGHPDHRYLRRYGRMLRRAGIPVSLYAELPYCVLHGWPPWVDGRAPEANRNVDAFWLSQLDGVPEIPALRSARVERLDDAAASAKLAAMRCYATQLPCLEYGARQLLADPEIHRFEVRWDLPPGMRA
ncbi:MAG TPA: PIG-L family deacetylase [Solirubrobacteraceae bacterium]|nr:PIG-L family deacetylase [Solirubrobacteraceae bacterium]